MCAANIAWETYQQRLALEKEVLKKYHSERDADTQPCSTPSSDLATSNIAANAFQALTASGVSSVPSSSPLGSSSSSSVTVSQLSSEQGWITPEEQLERFESIAVAKKVSFAVPPLIPDIAKIIAGYAVGECDPLLTNWYTALTRLGVLPKKIPPLPWHIRQILDSKCPVYDGQNKPDGTPYKIKDTHILYLIPKELGTLRHFQEDILNPYGARAYPEERDPLQFRYYLEKVYDKDGESSVQDSLFTTPFADTHWVLMTKDVLPGSLRQPWLPGLFGSSGPLKQPSRNDHVELIKELARKAFTAYEMPTLQENLSVIALHKVATKENFYYRINALNNLRTYICARVQESSLGCPVVGGVIPVKMCNYLHYLNVPLDVGVAALRKF